MHTIIEFLPVAFGLLVALLNRHLKPIFFEGDSCLFLCLIGGAFVNWLSREGVEFIILDIVTTIASTVGFFFLEKLVSIRHYRTLR